MLASEARLAREVIRGRNRRDASASEAYGALDSRAGRVYYYE